MCAVLACSVCLLAQGPDAHSQGSFTESDSVVRYHRFAGYLLYRHRPDGSPRDRTHRFCKLQAAAAVRHGRSGINLAKFEVNLLPTGERVGDCWYETSLPNLRASQRVLRLPWRGRIIFREPCWDGLRVFGEMKADLTCFGADRQRKLSEQVGLAPLCPSAPLALQLTRTNTRALITTRPSWSRSRSIATGRPDCCHSLLLALGTGEAELTSCRVASQQLAFVCERQAAEPCQVPVRSLVSPSGTLPLPSGAQTTAARTTSLSCILARSNFLNCVLRECLPSRRV